MAKVLIDQERCKGCRLCTLTCPRQLLQMSAKLNKIGIHPAQIQQQQKCTACGMCYLVCPDVAIEIWK